MTENTIKSIPVINAVDGFTPAEFTSNLPNEDGTMSMYLDVKYRLLWFRLHRPDGKIDTEIIHVDDKSAVVSCKLYENKDAHNITNGSCRFCGSRHLYTLFPEEKEGACG